MSFCSCWFFKVGVRQKLFLSSFSVCIILHFFFLFFFCLFSQPLVFLIQFCVLILHNHFIIFQQPFIHSVEIFTLLKEKKILFCMHCNTTSVVHFEEMSFINNLYIKLVCDDIFKCSSHYSEVLSASSFKLTSAWIENGS